MTQLGWFDPFNLVLNAPKSMYEIASKVWVSHGEVHDKVSHEKIDELVKSFNTFRKTMQNFIS